MMSVKEEIKQNLLKIETREERYEFLHLYPARTSAGGADTEVFVFEDFVAKISHRKNTKLYNFYKYCHHNPHPNLPSIEFISEGSGDGFWYIGKRYQKLSHLTESIKWFPFSTFCNFLKFQNIEIPKKAIKDTIVNEMIDDMIKIINFMPNYGQQFLNPSDNVSDELVDKIVDLIEVLKNIVYDENNEFGVSDLDIHEGNIMIDQETNNLVLNDPFYFGL